MQPPLPHHSIVGYSRDNAFASGSGSVPSMGVEIAASRTHRDNLRKRIMAFSESKIKSRLVEATEKMGPKDFCAPCWFDGTNPDHDGRDCPNIAHGWAWDGSAFRSWKGRYNLPDGHCFNCGLPQVGSQHILHIPYTESS